MHHKTRVIKPEWYDDSPFLPHSVHTDAPLRKVLSINFYVPENLLLMHLPDIAEYWHLLPYPVLFPEREVLLWSIRVHRAFRQNTYLTNTVWYMHIPPNWTIQAMLHNNPTFRLSPPLYIFGILHVTCDWQIMPAVFVIVAIVRLQTKYRHVPHPVHLRW